ncbi:HD domain-containing protein [Niastella populi]|uniref:HD domain-containing protein n=1 Tax=Niastella populi TaxID=550983 RepID=UPI001A98AEA3|nr:HD domain-containing protein [Niastella populi]
MKTNLSIDKLQNIWQKVTILHSGQTYGGSQKDERIEYINHIASVVFEIQNAMQHTADFDGELAVSCALLHDTIEDTSLTIDELKQLFGEQITAGVLALTKDKHKPKDQQMADSLARIKAQPKEIWAVKMADRICNLYAPPYYWNNQKKLGYIEEARIIPYPTERWK